MPGLRPDDLSRFMDGFCVVGGRNNAAERIFGGFEDQQTSGRSTPNSRKLAITGAVDEFQRRTMGLNLNAEQRYGVDEAFGAILDELIASITPATKPHYVPEFDDDETGSRLDPGTSHDYYD